MGQTWQWTYDNEDRVLSASAPAPTTGGAALVTQAQYDPVGNLTVAIAANGQVTKNRYDVRDALSEVDQSPNPWTDPNATPSPKYVTTYQYDHLGYLTRTTRAAGDATNERATDDTSDGLGRLRQGIQYPSWPSTSTTLVTHYGYDANGNQTSVTKPDTTTLNFTFDALNRLTGRDNPQVAYTYDADGNRLTMVDPTGTTSYTYDELDRLLSVSSPGSNGSNVVGYRYDLNSDRTKTLYPDSTAVTATFDKADRLTQLADWASRHTGYAYFADGQLQTVTNVDGTTAGYSYDNAQRLTQVLNQQGTTTISQHTYTLDPVGNRTQASELLPVLDGHGGFTTTAQVTTDGYDLLNQLISVQGPGGPTSIGYDPVGNRVRMTSGGWPTNYTLDKADRLQSAGLAACQVDRNGNLTSGCAGTFSYDAANRLLTATGVATTTYTLDGDGKRTHVQVAGHPNTHHFDYVYDVNGALPMVLVDGNSNGSLKYVWGPAGLAYAVDPSNAVTVSHSDGLGSVRALTNGAGTVVQTYQTDAFGVPTSTQGSSSQHVQFAGEQRDDDGLIDLRARAYDPALGRFLQRDTVAGSVADPLSLNRYTYALNNPVSLTDPSGMTPTSKVLAQATALCTANGWSNCDTITPDMAHEMFTGNAREVDWTNPSDALKDRVDAALFALSLTGGDGGAGLRMTREVAQQVAERWGIDLGGIAWRIDKGVLGPSGRTFKNASFTL